MIDSGLNHEPYYQFFKELHKMGLLGILQAKAEHERNKSKNLYAESLEGDVKNVTPVKTDDPTDILPDDEVGYYLNRLLDSTKDEEQKKQTQEKIQNMSLEERTDLAKAYRDQGRDWDQDDPEKRKYTPYRKRKV